MKARGQPYFKASFDDLNPGVGAYNLSKDSSKKQLPISGYRKTMPHDRLESAVRAAIVHGGVQNAASVAAGGKSKPRNDTTPGPGSYYIPSQTDINLVEFKYNPKYRGKRRWRLPRRSVWEEDSSV